MKHWSRNKQLKDKINGPEWIRLLILVLLLWLLTACGNSLYVINTDIEPIITENNELRVTLKDGEVKNIPIKSQEIQDTPKTECDASVYRDIGSYTYVEKVLNEEVFTGIVERLERKRELRKMIYDRQGELELDFHTNFPITKSIHLQCNLELQADDLIYVRLYFIGPSSSNVTVECLGDGQQRAQIRNPATTEFLKDRDKDVDMLVFKPGHCGVLPLDNGGDQYVDEYGGVRSECDPVKGVTIKNCRIRGRIVARSFPDIFHDLSMLRSDHVEQLQKSAPQHVTFSNVEIIGRYRGAIHLLPGVHHFTIEDSEILGGFHSMTIHLPADGGWNVIKNNRITGQRKINAAVFSYDSKQREVISIDASEHNRIVNNHISDMTFGGIHLYRNCGESGKVRHRIPQYNQIINNVFDYSTGRQGEATIYLGTRDDISNTIGGVKKYCNDDKRDDGQPYPSNDVLEAWDTAEVLSSSESDDDWAQHNVIADNQWIQFNPDDSIEPIKLSNKARLLDNYLINNSTSADRSVTTALNIQRGRGAGCAVLAGVTDFMQSPYTNPIKNGNLPYIRHGQPVKYFWDIQPQVQLTCGDPLVCINNILTPYPPIICEMPIIYDYGSDDEPCDAPNNVCDDGEIGSDSHTLGCPSGQLIGIQAACNLEYGRASDAERQLVLMNRVEVVRESDNLDEGSCQVDGTNIKQGKRLITPWLLTAYGDTGVPNEVNYSCSERDRRGGECHINVRHYCEPD